MVLYYRIHLLLIVLFIEVIYCRKNKRLFSDDENNKYDPHKHSKDTWSVEFSKNDGYESDFYDDKVNNDFDKKSHLTIKKKRPYKYEFDSIQTHHDHFFEQPYHDEKYDSEDFSHRPLFTFSKNKNLKKYNQIDNELKIKLGNDKYTLDYNIPSVNFNEHHTEKKKKNESSSKLVCNDPEYTCELQTKCPLTRFENFDSIQKCSLSFFEDNFGICCPPPEYPMTRVQINELPISKKATKAVYPKKIKYFPNANKRQYPLIRNNHSRHMEYIGQIKRAHVNLKSAPLRNGPEMAHHNFFGNYKEALLLGLKGENSIRKALEIARKSYIRRLSEESSSLVISKDIETIAIECPKDPVCPLSKYRTADGSCNNLIYPNFGKAFSPYNRVLNPSYGDGINSPRLSKEKDELPNSRKLSIQLVKHKKPIKSRLTLAAMQFGQFIDHDIASAAPTRTEEGNAISCCESNMEVDPINFKHPSCFEIPISQNDVFFKQFNVTCMNFVRSVAAPRSDCKLAPREQLNQPTAFVDGSQIYGSSKETQESLRSFIGGKLLSSVLNKNKFLPRQTNGTCNVPSARVDQCFRAGDPRVNENIHLTVLQTVFLREHNRIAKELSDLNPSFSDERLFQETKAIVSAEIQHILYTEFLPAVLNRKTLIQFGLLPTEQGFLHKYDPQINPMLYNAFATASYRWHSSVQGSLQLRNNKNQLFGRIPLSSTFNNPTLLARPGVLDGLLIGMTSQPMQEIDEYFTEEMTNKLFKPWNSSFGLDIFAINVQRGRDHGLKGYPSWLKQCGLSKVKNFDDLNFLMPKHIIEILKRNYASVYDIDLYVAGILEYHSPNSELGPLFSCMVAEQFRRLKYGDRFFYENAEQINSFTSEQLAEIKKVSLARLICDNGDHIENMQPYVFILTRYFWNKKVSCNSELIPRMSLDPWAK